MSPRVAGIILAAGASRRYGNRNKLTERCEGKALVSHAVDAVLTAGLQPVVVVTGHDAERVEEALPGRAVSFVYHAAYAHGMGSSLAAGVRSLRDTDGVAIALGDMPRIRTTHVRRVVEAFETNHASFGDDTLCVPTFAGRRGHPVAFGRAHLPALRKLAGANGARDLLASRAEHLVEVPMSDDGVLLDIDRATDWGDLRRD